MRKLSLYEDIKVFERSLLTGQNMEIAKMGREYYKTGNFANSRGRNTTTTKYFSIYSKKQSL